MKFTLLGSPSSVRVQVFLFMFAACAAVAAPEGRQFKELPELVLHLRVLTPLDRSRPLFRPASVSTSSQLQVTNMTGTY